MAGVVGVFGGLKEATAKLMLLGLAGGLISTLATATTGFVDWLELDWGTPLWRTATWHMLVMLTATALFLSPHSFNATVNIGNTVEPIALGVTLLGFVGLTVGGWLGGGHRLCLWDARLEAGEHSGPGCGDARQGAGVTG